MENIMKRVVLGSMTALFFMIALSAIAGAQSASLGDYARLVKKNKPQATKAPAKVYDNDNLPSATISVVGAPAPAATDAAKDNKDNKQPDAKADDKTAASTPKTDEKAEKKAVTEIKPGQSPEERQKAYDGWKTRIADQKKKVDALAHDLDDFQHNSTLAQVSVWPETQKYGQGLADKQKALAQAKADLNDLQEQARKAGVPASVAE
jgi:hypothetical protein